MLSYFHLPHTIYVRKAGALTIKGQVEWLEAKSYPCRFEDTHRLLTIADGKQVTTSFIVFVSAEELDETSLYFLLAEDASDLSKGKEPLSIQRHTHLVTGQYSHSSILF